MDWSILVGFYQESHFVKGKDTNKTGLYVKVLFGLGNAKEEEFLPTSQVVHGSLEHSW